MFQTTLYKKCFNLLNIVRTNEITEVKTNIYENIETYNNFTNIKTFRIELLKKLVKKKKTKFKD